MRLSIILILLISIQCFSQGIVYKDALYKELVIKNTIQLSEKDIHNYLDTTYNAFNDSIDATSGLLGWKNIRDYFLFGEETMQEKSKRIWFAVYDSSRITEIVKSHLQDAYIALNKDTTSLLLSSISGQKQINIYAHRVGISLLSLIVEEAIEILLGATVVSIGLFLYVFFQFNIGGWERWSKKRRKKVNKIRGKILKRTSGAFFLIVLFFTLIKGDPAENQLKKQVEKGILIEAKKQIVENLNQ